MKDIYKDLMLLEDEQEEQEKDIIFDELHSLTHLYKDDEDEGTIEVPWYCFLESVASDFGYDYQEMINLIKDSPDYIVFKIHPVGSFDGAICIGAKGLNLDVVKEDIKKMCEDDFGDEDVEVKISLKEDVREYHFDASSVYDAEQQLKQLFKLSKEEPKDNGRYYIFKDSDGNVIAHYDPHHKIVHVSKSIKEGKLDDLKVSSYKYLLDVYDRDDNFIERKFFRSRPEADKFVDAMEDLFDIKIFNNEVVEIKNGKDFFGTYWKVIRDLKKDESFENHKKEIEKILEHLGFEIKLDESINNTIKAVTKESSQTSDSFNEYIEKLEESLDDSCAFSVGLQNDGHVVCNIDIKEAREEKFTKMSQEQVDRLQELIDLWFNNESSSYGIVDAYINDRNNHIKVNALDYSMDTCGDDVSHDYYKADFNDSEWEYIISGNLPLEEEVKSISNFTDLNAEQRQRANERVLNNLIKDVLVKRDSCKMQLEWNGPRNYGVLFYYKGGDKLHKDGISFEDCKYILDGNLKEDIEKHDTLNQKLFDGEELKPEVVEAIKNIANEFVKELGEDGISFTLKDIILLGSNMSYNYTKDSDLDIHLIADSSALECPKELQDKLYGAYRTIFNKNYDITIKGIPAEVYVELDEPQAKSNGIYSLNNGWVKKPEQQAIPELDKEAFDEFFKFWEDRYNELINNKEATSQDVEEYINDIYDERKDGIANDGEYSLGNLLFKEVRNKGYLDNLKELRKELKGKELSLEHLEEDAEVGEEVTLENVRKWLKTGGATIQNKTGKSVVYKDGFEISFNEPEVKFKVDLDNDKDIQKVVRVLKKRIKENKHPYTGIWYEDDSVVMDYSKHFKGSREDAIKDAIKNNQRMIFNWGYTSEDDKYISTVDNK